MSLKSNLYNASRSLGKVASTVNDLDNLSKSIKTGNPSYFLNRVARKVTTKKANKVARNINNMFK